ncbi:MAG: hypothetical protein IME99_08015 [Proteobacteria bacterium]|nr:hypothetical protein [Pseudomonadota bacterium]
MAKVVTDRFHRGKRGALGRLLSFVVAAFVSISLLAITTEASAGPNHPHHISTDYATIHFSDPAALEGLSDILEQSAATPRFVSSSSTGSSIDRIVFRVRNILGIHTPGFHFNIYLLDSATELEAIYTEMGFGDSAPPAFYSRSTGSVFVSLDAVNDGILAHEVAHAVINSHYTPPLPTRMQEILAQFVDKNLWVE